MSNDAYKLSFKNVKYDPWSSMLTESNQAAPIRMAFVTLNDEDRRVELAHEFVRCTDFMNDALVSFTLEQDLGKVYGFHFKGDLYKLDDLCLRCVVRYDTSVETNEAVNMHYLPFFNLNALHEMEDRFFFYKTSVTSIEPETDDGAQKYQYYYIEADAQWMSATPLLSLYLYLIRAIGWEIPNVNTIEDLLDTVPSLNETLNINGLTQKAKRLLRNDFSYMHSILRYRYHIFNDAQDNPAGFISPPKTFTLDTVHDALGIQTLIEGADPELCEYRYGREGVPANWASSAWVERLKEVQAEPNKYPKFERT